MKNKHESHHANNENKVDNDVSSEDEIIEDMEQVAAEMEKYVELNKTVEDKESNQWVCLYFHTYLFVTSIRSYDNQWKIKEIKQND